MTNGASISPSLESFWLPVCRKPDPRQLRGS
jgi:hypothetical protein